MADTTTPHYGWIKPEVSGSNSTWGTKQNGVFDQIDAQVYTAMQVGLPVGSITMYAGPASSLPANWFLCAGQAVATASAPALFAVIGYRYGGSGGTFNLPQLINRFPLGMNDGENPGAVGGEFTHTLSVAEMPSHAHAVSDPGHAHGVSQSGHVHPDPGHTHAASQDPHNHTYVHSAITGLSGIAFGTFSGFTTDVVSTAQPAVHIGAAATGLFAANANISINGAGTGIGIFANGSSGAHNNMNHYMYLNFIIKYQ